MNASSFITFATYMLRQNGICDYKGRYVTFKLAPDLKKNTVYSSSYIPLNEGRLSILTNCMLWIYTSDIEERIILRWICEISWIFQGSIPIYLSYDSVKVAKIRNVFVRLHRIVFANVPLCLQIYGKQNTTFQFSVKLISYKMSEQHLN